MDTNDKTIKVYYNSACPVCKAGIEAQQGELQACQIAWQDVHADNSLAAEVGAELEFVRERLHVVDAKGRVLVGFAALLEIGRHSPKQQKWVKVLGLPGIRQFGGLAYNGFAAVLYRWNRLKKHW